MTRIRFFLIVSLVLAILALNGCGSGNSSTTTPPTQIKVAITTSSGATPPQITQSQTVTLTATVTGDTSGVKWGTPTCSASSCGTLTNTTATSATYNPPTGILTANLTVTVTATSVKDPTVSASQTITVMPPAVSVTITPSVASGQVEQGQTQPFTMTATSGDSAGVNWGTPTCSASACGTLSNTSTTGATYVPPTAALTSNLTVTVTATSVTDSTKSATQTITVVPTLATTAPSSASLVANIGSSYSLTLQTATGTGVAPFTWSVATGSTLPSWLSLSAGGVLSAATVPGTAANTPQITLQVKDAFNVTASLPITIDVPIKVVTTSVPSAEQTQTSYTATLTAGGGTGPYTWSITSGTLPAGLTLATNGSITGAPTASAATQTFTVQATDSTSAKASQQLTLSVNPKLAVTTPTAASLVANIGSAYSLTLQTTAGTGVGPFTWSVASGSTLPSWLTFTGGVLSAATVPTTATTTPQFSVKVTDSANVSVSLPLTVTVPMKIVTTSLPSVEQTQSSYSATLTAEGGSGTYTWSITTGALPAGLTLAPNGSITGSPTTSATTQTFTVQASDSSTVATQQLTLSVNPKLAVTTPTAASLIANIGSAYSLTLQTTAGTGVGPFTWSLASGSTLPSWLTLTPAGVLSAATVPTSAVTTPQFSVKVTDSAAISVTLPLTVTVPIKIVTASLSAGEVSAPYASGALAAEGGSGTYTWSATGLPAWAAINPSTGAITGTTPTQGTSTITVTATDTLSAVGTAQLTLTINPLVTVSTTSLPNAPVSTLYSQTLAATGGVVPYGNWQLSGSGSLPTGFTLNASTGVISGTPTCPTATANFSVTVRDSLNITSAAKALSITTTATPLVITPASNLTASVNQAFSQQLHSTGGACGATITWSMVSGAPAWLSLSSTGVLSGTPGSGDIGSPTFTVQATDGVNPVQQSFTIVVAASGHNVSGTVSVVNGGAGVSGAVVSLDGTLNATTNSSGQFTIPSVPNGTHTVTVVSIPQTAPSSAVYPHTQSVTVSSADVTGINFTAAYGYKVSGVVSYHGQHYHGGQIFFSLQNTACAASGCPAILGTSLLAADDSIPGDPTTTPPTPGTPEHFDLAFGPINGVPPGTYTLTAWMDYVRYGVPNAYNPAGTATVTVGAANVTSANVTLLDPTAAVATPVAPAMKIFPIDQGVIVEYQPIVKNGVEQAQFYNLQWTSDTDPSTNISSCETGPDGGYIFSTNEIAAGGGRFVIIDSANPASTNLFSGLLQNGSQYRFCMQGIAINSIPAAVLGAWAVETTMVTVGEPAAGSGTNTLSGNVTVPDSASPSGPLYAGCYDEKTDNLYAASIEQSALVTASVGVNPYQVNGIPTGAACFPFAVIDQSNDGLITPSNPGAITSSINQALGGDIYNLNDPTTSIVNITASTTKNIDLTAYTANSGSTLTTQHLKAVSLSNSTSESYNLHLTVNPLVQLPVTVTLLSGPNVMAPMDFAVCTTCSGSEFNLLLNTNGVRPQVGDTYKIQISYGDSSILPDSATLMVTGVSDSFATASSPSGTGAGTTPTFSWIDPTNASSFIYQFSLMDSLDNLIWQVPGQQTPTTNGFSSSITSVPWSTTVDPTGANNGASVTSLTTGATYTWSISTIDPNNGNNTATYQVTFQP